MGRGAEERGDRHVSIDVTTSGFVIVDKDGTTLAWRENFEEALEAQRAIDAAEDVRRLSDGVVCATKCRLRGPCFWSQLWEDAA